LKEYLIGAGGWAYFRVPGINTLAAYCRVFNFVEVNSTFYQMPTLSEVEKWRRMVPPDFQFSVRANRSITHTYKLEPTQESFEAFEKTKQICRILKADIMHMQTPPSLRWDKVKVENLRQFLSSFDVRKLRLALEVREARQEKLPSELLKAMQDNNMIHCVDLSKNESPAYESDILYTRLFGKGEHNIYQPTDGELAEIDNKASSSKSQRIVMSFHFVRMYKDAVRLKTYKQTGKFPMITGSTGIDSLEEVLREDTRFPTTKEELIHMQGWKLFDMTKTERIYANELLQKLPEATYHDMGEVTEKLRSVTR
jgi:uncharacterized protein YecE (DUF72 family)